MQRVLAIAFLTVKAAFRYRLVVVLGLLLLGSVIALPLIIKDDGTASGFTQILLTYTLTVITTLLGFATLWLACGSLAREVEECQMQMVAVKPIARWQIWLGKWLGIIAVNALLLAVSGGLVYGLLLWRAQQLPKPQQDILRNEILVARGSLKEKPINIEAEVSQAVENRVRQSKNPLTVQDLAMLRAQAREFFRARMQIVGPGQFRRWIIDFGSLKEKLRQQPIALRVKFSVSDQNVSSIGPPKTYPIFWQAGVPDSKKTAWRETIKLAADTFHEFKLPPDLYDENGKLTIDCVNLTGGGGDNAPPTNMLFQVEDGLEVLYRESGFTLNFMRGLAIIFCWLAALTALGLTAASFLSFPVAAFLSLGALAVCLSSGTLSQVVAEGGISGVNHDTGKIDTPLILDRIVVPTFTAMLKLVNLVQGFSPIDSLSSGRSISWSELGRAVAQIVVIIGGLLALLGMIFFERRELATAQNTQ